MMSCLGPRRVGIRMRSAAGRVSARGGDEPRRANGRRLDEAAARLPSMKGPRMGCSVSIVGQAPRAPLRLTARTQCAVPSPEGVPPRAGRPDFWSPVPAEPQPMTPAGPPGAAQLSRGDQGAAS
jgi:hypothetical protein